MKKRTQFFVFAILIISLVMILEKPFAWTEEKNHKGNIQKMRMIQDMKGRSIQIPDPLNRVALFGGPSGQVAYILGVQDKLCAVTQTLVMSKLISLMDPRIKSLPAPRTVNGSVNIEELLGSKAELVIAGEIDGNIVEKKTRIPVAYLEDSMSNGIEIIKKEIQFYGQVFKKETRAQNYIRYLDQVMDMVRLRTSDIPANKRKRVFHGYHHNHLVTFGGDTFMQERIIVAGCINAAISIQTIGKRTGLHSGLGEVSMEQVLEWNPDILIINSGTLDEIYSDPRWCKVNAVKNRQVFFQPAGVFIFNRPTAESAVLYPLWLATVSYPERFKDIFLENEVLKFFREIMKFDLTRQHAQDIISGAYENKIMKGVAY